MKVIKAFKRLLHLLRNNEHVNFLMNIVAFVKVRRDSITEILPSWTAFLKQYEREDDIYKRNAKQVETKYIAEAHQERYDAFMMFRRSVEAAAYSHDAAIKDAYVKLNETLENYKTVTTAPITEVSALVYNMIEDLRKPRYAEAVEELDLEAVVDKLEDANIKFLDIYAERTQNMEEFEEQGNMKSIRPLVDSAFKAFADSVNSLYTIKKLAGVPDANNPALPIITYINGFIDQYEHIYAHRTPGYTIPDKDNPGDDEDEEELTPDAGTPTLAISDQEVESSKRMLLIAEDQAAFERVLYPAAEGGIMLLTSDEYNDYNEFPISEFEMDGGKPVGLVVSPPSEGMVFRKPIYIMVSAHADVIKDGELLATLTGVVWPESYWE
jgi:hypothetical protein